MNGQWTENGQWVEGETNEGIGSQVEHSLAAFKKELEEGFGRVGSAADHLKAIVGAIEMAERRLDSTLESHRSLQEQSSKSVDEARSLLTEMHEVKDEVRGARKETEDLRDSITRMTGDLTALTDDLRTRIAALAVLAQPLPEMVPQHYAQQDNGPVQEEAYAEAV